MSGVLRRTGTGIQTLEKHVGRASAFAEMGFVTPASINFAPRQYNVGSRAWSRSGAVVLDACNREQRNLRHVQGRRNAIPSQPGMDCLT